MRKRYLCASIILHALLIFGIGTGTDQRNAGTGEEESTAHGSPSSDKIIDKPTEVDIHIPPESEEEMKSKRAEQKPAADCPDEESFGGIGIYFDRYEQIINEVVPGYSASRAGLKAGDHLITSFMKIKGEVGTLVDVTIYRPNEGREITFTLIRDKVCFKSRKKSHDH